VAALCKVSLTRSFCDDRDCLAINY